MNIILAENAGFCFGVSRAVDEAVKIQKKENRKIYTLGPLIHNNDVVKYLEKNNIYALELEDALKLPELNVIIIRSHGISEDILNSLKNAKLKIYNLTCPFVSNIQKKVRKYADEGYQIIILGNKNHPEVIGINGWCYNNAIITINGEFSENEKRGIKPKVCLVSQTTLKIEDYQNAVKNISILTKELIAFNTICASTKVRQKSADKVSKKVDAMIVIGGKNSSNTTKLYEISKRNCKNTIHIENSKELTMDFINKNYKNIGITAGASTPDWIIREVLDKMNTENNTQENANASEDQLALMEKIDKKISIGTVIEDEVISKDNDGVIIKINGYGIDGIIPYKELTIKSDSRKYAESLNPGDKIKAKVIRLQNNDGYVVLSKVEYEKGFALDELKTLFDEEKTFAVNVTEAREKGLVADYKGARVFIPASQIDARFVKDKTPYVGKTLEVKLIDFSLKHPTKVVASRRVLVEAEENKKAEKVWESFNVGDVVKGKVVRFTNFGAFIEVNGVDGLLHLSQISWNHINSAEDILKKDQDIEVKIIGLDKDARKLSLSLKELMPKPWDKVNDKYPVDSIVLGKVVRLNDFGAFVELEPGVDGLVHISKISHNRIGHPSEVLSVGQEVKCKILSVDEEKKRISLSIKDVE